VSEYLTDKDVATTFDISFQQVQQRCKKGQWPHIRIGRKYRFTPDHVAAIAKLHEVAPPDRPDTTAGNTWGQKTRRSA
jgi:hypothetical protein